VTDDYDDDDDDDDDDKEVVRKLAQGGSTETAVCRPSYARFTRQLAC